MTIVDTIFKALAPALPEQVIAGHHADLVVGRINGRRPKDNSFSRGRMALGSSWIKAEDMP